MALFYNKSESITNYNTSSFSSEANGYGVRFGYGILYPLLKNFYAELTPGILYSYDRYLSESNDIKTTTSIYSTELTGGLLWIPFKHFGISGNLAAISLQYSNSKSSSASGFQSNQTSSSFAFTNQGSLQNQTFSIFYKF